MFAWTEKNDQRIDLPCVSLPKYHKLSMYVFKDLVKFEQETIYCKYFSVSLKSAIWSLYQV